MNLSERKAKLGEQLTEIRTKLRETLNEEELRLATEYVLVRLEMREISIAQQILGEG